MLSAALGLGLVAQSMFVGGNVVISSICVPLLRQNYISDATRVKQFSLLYDSAAKIMAASAAISTACFGYLYFYGPQLYKVNFLVAAAASLSPLPVTYGVILPTVMALKRMADDGASASQSLPALNKWNNLSIFRVSLFSVGFVSSLHYVLSALFP